ncbi:MAG: amidohydrolase family protein [Sulfolobales archaeon]
MTKYALTNCYVFDGLGNVFKGSVIIDGGMIVDVGSEGSVKVPEDAKVIDLGGNYLLPGLIDAHLHLVGMRTGDFVKEPLLTPYETFVARVVKDLEELIYSGFTTVGDAGSLIAAKIKYAVNEGTILGPRIVASGLPLSPTFGHGDTHYLPVEYVDYRTSRKLVPLASLICDGVDECRKAARYALREDADFIKIMTTGGVLSQKDRPEYRQFTLDEIKAIVDEARAAGRFVHAHAQGVEGIRNAILGGVKVIAHAIYIDEESIALSKEFDAIIVPTLSIVDRILSIGSKIGIPEWALRKADEVNKEHINNIRKAYRLGAKIAVGTDFCGGPLKMGDNALEIKLLVEKIGMEPKEALIAATKISAEAVGLSGKVGTIERGKIADLIVVSGNPLVDVNILQNKENIRLVMKEGKIVKNIKNGTTSTE